MFFLISLRFIIVSFYYERVHTNKMNPVDFSVVEEMLSFEMSPFEEKIPLGQRDVASDVKFALFVGRNYYDIVLTLAYCFQVVDKMWLFERMEILEQRGQKIASETFSRTECK